MRDLRVLVADDELLARKRILRLAEAIDGVRIVGDCADGAEVLEALKEEPVDLLLLDIQMPGLDGLEVGQLLAEEEGGPVVVYTTAHREHALSAFDIGAADYLLKPVEAGRLQRAVDRARATLRAREEGARLPSDPAPGRVALPTRKGVRLVDPTEVLCALWDGTALTVHAGEERIFVDMTLSQLEARLPAPPFLRSHRRAILNLDRVELLEPVDSGGYLARMKDGPKVAVSRAVSRELRRRFGLGRG